MYRYRYALIKTDELNTFLKNCPARLLKLSEGQVDDVFEKAIFEHNLYSLSKVYENISFKSLKRYFNMDIEKVV